MTETHGAVANVSTPPLTEATISNDAQNQQKSETPRKIVVPRRLQGFRDLLPQQAETKSMMIESLERVFRSFGYPKIETPHLEFTEVLIGDEAAEISKQLYRFKDNGARDVALRFDLTVPLARYVVEHRSELEFPFKRHAIGNVFRGESPQAGRYREFTQCDFDIVGNEVFDHSRSADAEIIQVIAACLDALNVGDYSISLNNRKIFNGLCSHIGLGKEQGVLALRIIDKISKIGLEGVQDELTKKSITNEQGEALLNLVKLSDGADSKTVLGRLESYRSFGGDLEKGIQELTDVLEILDYLPNLEDKYKVDLSIARGLDYYTGIVFETFLKDAPAIGSVSSGGRYDNLTSTFSKDRLPGVGGSVGLDRLMAALEQTKSLGSPKTPAAIMVMLTDNVPFGELHHLALQLRSEGLRVELYAQPERDDKQRKFAHKKGHTYVLRVKSDEEFSVRNMLTGEENMFDSLGSVVTYFKDHL